VIINREDILLYFCYVIGGVFRGALVTFQTSKPVHRSSAMFAWDNIDFCEIRAFDFVGNFPRYIIFKQKLGNLDFQCSGQNHNLLLI